MRLGVIHEPNAAAYYRAIDPMLVMQKRGHEIVWPEQGGLGDMKKLRACDVVHIYRRADDAMVTLMRKGMRVTYDNDDDFTTVPEESPSYPQVGGAAGRRVHALTVRMAQNARCFTTTNERLAARYREDGVERIEVIPNSTSPFLPRPRVDHDGFVIGWVAGVDHAADVARLEIREALVRLQAKHPRVRVECIGLDLKLTERYRHHPYVDFRELPKHIGGWDVGLAPLADIPGNQTRSDIKVREYAASGVPWLASPVGPYRELGEDQGGMLVPDGGWFDALDRMVGGWWKRRGLARQAQRWARGITIDAVADRWERVFTEAAAG